MRLNTCSWNNRNRNRMNGNEGVQNALLSEPERRAKEPNPSGERKKSRSARVLLDSAIRERECAAAKYVRRCAYVYVYCITVERSKESIKRM